MAMMRTRDQLVGVMMTSTVSVVVVAQLEAVEVWKGRRTGDDKAEHSPRTPGGLMGCQSVFKQKNTGISLIAVTQVGKSIICAVTNIWFLFGPIWDTALLSGGIAGPRAEEVPVVGGWVVALAISRQLCAALASGRSSHGQRGATASSTWSARRSVSRERSNRQQSLLPITTAVATIDRDRGVAILNDS